jgi:hypothetical protein
MIEEIEKLIKNKKKVIIEIMSEDHNVWLYGCEIYKRNHYENGKPQYFFVKGGTVGLVLYLEKIKTINRVEDEYNKGIWFMYTKWKIYILET